ncbi:translocation/assembly module TamB domain-containing protein [Taibaiella soli]|uniref:Translocation and assembly module TamB C-terminal domain-containing protein n=1 Tax=Taibaiella soli TaxID=1649169 RepID=A0A2W2AKS7_9BACT|nr:translocation/assembly module TamB domain-containing protein [Taibaiella soli]PZF72880.1 hypothetical protein DN068_10735 [Taibaiella soli]
MRKFFKIVGYVIGSILLLLIGVVIWLQTPSGKNFVRKQAVAFLTKKLKTEVYIGAINYRLPKMIELDSVLFKDQAKDTLLAAAKLRVDINMLALISSKVVVQQLELEGLNAHIYRHAPDTNYNFAYIIHAFVGEPKTPSPAEAKKVNDTSSLKFDVDKINFDNIRIRFDDETAGMKLAVKLDQLRLTLRKIDLTKMDFGIKKLAVSGLQTSFYQDTSYLPPSTDTSAGADFHLAADEIEIDKTTFTYGDNLSKFLFDINVGRLALKPKEFSLKKQFIDLSSLQLANTAVKIWMGKTAPKKTATVTPDTASSSNWRVQLTEGKLNNVSYVMDDENSPKQKSGMDYMHLNAQNLNLDAEDLLYTSDTISGNIKHLSVKEKSGFDLRELKTQFAYYSKGAYLRNLLLQTDQTVIQNYIQIGYASLTALQKNMQAMQLKINVQKSVVGVKDILIFMPSMADYDLIRKNKNGHLKLDAVLQGTLGNLAIDKFNLSGLGRTEVAMKGKLLGVPDANRIAYDFNIQKLQSSRTDLESFLPKSVNDQIRLPDAFGLTGRVTGTTKDYKMQLMFMSTDGKAYLNGYVLMSPGKNRERYDLYLRTDALNLGRILKQEQNLGKITSTFSVKGSSFDVHSMTANVKGGIQSATIKGYTYTGITLDGNVAAKKGNVHFVSTDKNAKFSLVANADFGNKYPGFVADLNVDSIDMQAIGFSTTESRIRGIVHADVPVLNVDYPQGVITMRDLVIVNDGQRFFQDSLYVASTPQDSLNHIKIDLRVLQANIDGHLALSQIGNVVQDHLNRHYTVKKIVDVKNKKQVKIVPVKVPDNYDLTLNAFMVDGPLIHTLAPGLTRVDTLKIAGRLDPKTMKLNASLARLNYASNRIRGVKANIEEADSSLNYDVVVARFSRGNLRLVNTTLKGSLTSDEITAALNVQDTAKKDRFALSAKMSQDGDDRTITLGNRLLLNYEEWSVKEGNKFVIGPKGFYAQGIDISHEKELLSINSKAATYNAPMSIDINNFRIANVTGIISSPDTLLADGVVSGTVDLNQISPDLMMAADLKIHNLTVLNDTIGDLTAKAESKNANSINTSVAITGYGNDIQLDGMYYIQPVDGNNFDFQLKMNALALKSMESLAGGQIKNSSGFLRGNLAIKGTTDAPKITGTLNTDKLETTVTMLNADFHMPGEKINFDEKGIQFDKFRILDSAGNAFTINGYVLTEDYSNMNLDLQLTAKKWRALHSQAKDNKLFYGDVYLSSKLHITGPLSAIDVDGDLGILNGTNFTLALPDKDPEIEKGNGVVVFINPRDKGRNRILLPKTDTIKRAKVSPGSGINVNVNIEDNAQFNVIVDQGTGDRLTVKGKASLNASVTAGGVVGLTGEYELKSGSYQLHYNMLNRTFNIKPGSMITFAGDPIDGTRLDITAVYVAQAAPYDLVAKQVPDQSQLNYYKQRLPFDVDLILKGQIMQPEISFDIELPEGKNYRLSSDGVDLVRNRLTQLRTEPSEMNKQVFALLILNSFVGEDPLSSGAGGSVEFAAKQSVSSFISDQLNRYASSLVKGVDLSVDLATQEDYTSGERAERTDLNIAASKSLLNDRLTVTVGNNFELSGPQSSNNQQASLIPGNLSADYKLTTDGRYNVRVYRTDQDAGALEGYVTETGVNFIVNLDYNRFKNLFNRKKRQRQREEQKKLMDQKTNDTTNAQQKK